MAPPARTARSTTTGTYLFCCLDDHSRAVMTARFAFAEDTIRLAAALAIEATPRRISVKKC